MAVKIGNVIVNFITNTAAFESDMKKVTRSLRSMERTFSSAGRTLTTALTLPIIAAGGTILKFGTDFETAFAGVAKTVDATTEQLDALSSSIRKMSTDIPVTAVELARIAEAAGQLGIKTENIMGFTRVMADLGVATNMTSEEAATSLARLANITQMPQEEFGRLGSTVVDLGNKMATTESEIVNMGLRLAGAGKQIGLTEAQILSFGAALSSVGIEAEAGGSAFSKIFIEMASEVANSGKKLSTFAAVAGMSAESFSRAFKEDAAGAIVKFISGLGRMNESGQSALVVLEKLGITEVRTRDALLRTSGAGKLVAEALALGTKAWKDNTALTKEADRFYATTANQLKMLANRLMDVGVTLFTSLKPAIDSIIPLLRSIAEQVRVAAKWFAELPEGVRTSTVVILGLAAALGPLLWAFGSMATGIRSLIPLAVGLSSKLKGIAYSLTSLSILTHVRSFADLKAAVSLLAGSLGMLGRISVGIGAFWVGWKLGELLRNIGWVNAAGEKMAGWIMKIPGLAPNVTRPLADLESQTGKVAAKLKELGHNADRMAGEGVIAWADRVKKVYNEYKKLHPEAIKTTVATDELDDIIKKIIPDLAGFGNTAGDLRKQLASALFPMDDLEKKIKAQMAILSKPDQVRLYADEIMAAANRQVELGNTLTDSQKLLRAMAYDFILFRENAKATADGPIALAGALTVMNDALIENSRLIDEQIEKQRGLQFDLPEQRDWSDIPGVGEIEKAVDRQGKAIDRSRDSVGRLGQEVSTIFTNMAQDIAGNIIEWKGWADTLLGTVKSLAKALLSALIQGFFSKLISYLGGLGGGFGDFFGGLFGWVSGGGGGGGWKSLVGLGGGTPSMAASGAAGIAGATSISASLASLGTSILGGLSALGAGIVAALPAIATNPIGWAVGGGIGAYYGIKKLVGAIQGPNSWEAMSKEISRDYGGIKLSDSQAEAFAQQFGITEKEAWSDRKQITSSPAMLAYLYEISKQQGKAAAFLGSLSRMGQGKYGEVDYLTPFKIGLATGDWSKLNETWANQGLAESGLGAKITGGAGSLFLPSQTPLSAEAAAYLKQSNMGSMPSSKGIFGSVGSLMQDTLKRTTPNVTVQQSTGPLQITIHGAGDDLVTRIRRDVIPVIKEQMLGGNSGLREAVTMAVRRTAGAY